MAHAPKANSFSKEDVAIAQVAKALSHPARVQILRTLICAELCNCGDLVEQVPLAQSTVSQHLKALKDAGVIHGKSQGLQSSYSVNYEMLLPAIQRLEQFFSLINEKKGVSSCKKEKTECC